MSRTAAVALTSLALSLLSGANSVAGAATLSRFGAQLSGAPVVQAQAGQCVNGYRIIRRTPRDGGRTSGLVIKC
jgi:hypothetical protein